MYYDYFGLNQPPFRITPDTSLFFPGGNRGAVLEAMIYAIVSGEGIVKVVGEVGSGKTMLCRMLTVELPENVEVVYLANPSLSPDNILHAIAFELDLDVAEGDDRLRVMNKLQHYLLERHAENRQVVVFVEEAQSMPLATLEEIRLLSNLETRQNKLLQIVLFGQPELDHMIASKEIRQLKERITYSFDLGPLKPDEIRDYINSRLRACGYRANEPFNKGAIKVMARYSKGLLRRINILADKAMLAAYAGNVHTVTANHVHAAARDSEFIMGRKRYRLWFGIASVAGLVLLAAMLIPYPGLLQGNITPVPAVTTPAPPAETDMTSSTAEPQQKEESAQPAGKEPSTLYQPQDNSRYFDYFTPGKVDKSVSANPVQESEFTNISEKKPAAADTPATATLPEEKPMENHEPATITASGDTLYDQIRAGAPHLSGQQAGELVEQLRKLPPESRLLSAGNACKICSSFIYRPLKMNENL